MGLYFNGENPAVDMLVFAEDPKTMDICIAMIERGAEPYKGHYALPGGFIESKTPGNIGLEHIASETAEEAARRESIEETGFDPGKRLQKVGYYPDPKRDPRSNGENIVTSTAFCLILPKNKDSMPKIKGGDDAADAKWIPLKTIVSGKIPIALGHGQFIVDAIRMHPELGIGLRGILRGNSNVKNVQQRTNTISDFVEKNGINFER